MHVSNIAAASVLLCARVWLSQATDAVGNPNLGSCVATLTSVDDGSVYDGADIGGFKVGVYDDRYHDFSGSDAYSVEVTQVDNGYKDVVDTCQAWMFTDRGLRGLTTVFSNSSSYFDALETSLFGFHPIIGLLHSNTRSFRVLYESKVCTVQFYKDDTWIGDLGSRVGIAGAYYGNVMIGLGMTPDDMESMRIYGDASCYVELYTGYWCESKNLVATVEGTGTYDAAELAALGYESNTMRCFKVMAHSGVQSITWHTHEALISDPQLEYGATQFMDNSESSAEVSWTESLTQSETIGWSFEESYGFSTTVTASASFEIAAVDASLEVSTTSEFSWTSSNSGESTVEVSKEININVGPYTKVQCSLQIYSGDMIIPYTAIFQGIDDYGLYYTANVTGTFRTDYFFGNNLVCEDLHGNEASSLGDVMFAVGILTSVVLSLTVV